jgi:tetratricopeptide (TPR) repeat protein
VNRFRPILCACALVPVILGAGAHAQKQTQTQTQPRTQAASPDARAVERRLLAAVRATPDSFAAQRALAEFYLAARQLTQAIPALERARDLDPSHDANGYDLARAYLETGALDAARRQVGRMLAVNESAELLNLLGDVDARAEDYVAAAVSYQRAAHMAPTEEHLFDWGDNLLRLRAYDDAVDVFTASIRRHPASARLHIGLGIAQYSRGRHEEAVTSFCTAADLAPADPRPYAFLGEMYGVSPAQSDEITKRLARFVALKPADANGQYYYAMSLWRAPATGTGPDLARIEALLRKAMALDSRHAKARVQLGILLSEQRRWTEAIEALRAAIALEPDLAQAHFRLAQAYRRTGQASLADRELATFETLKARDAAPPVPE